MTSGKAWNFLVHVATLQPVYNMNSLKKQSKNKRNLTNGYMHHCWTEFKVIFNVLLQSNHYKGSLLPLISKSTSRHSPHWDKNMHHCQQKLLVCCPGHRCFLRHIILIPSGVIYKMLWLWGSFVTYNWNLSSLILITWNTLMLYVCNYILVFIILLFIRFLKPLYTCR